MDELQTGLSEETPVRAVFGDLMSALLGVFVLILVWVVGYQLQLSASLDEEIVRREQAEQRREALEIALADPLAMGRITMNDGRIGINGSVLFDLNSNVLQVNGQALLASLVGPLKTYLGSRRELLMISGFTDDLPIQRGNLQFEDNWELSAQRALTVTRALIEAGMPADLLFAAAFGDSQPVADNLSDKGRALNRRVEIAPVPMASDND